ncbi:type I restriction endonuclease subunit R, EcoR124 family [Lactobacillus bombicola]|uniref:type I restriction endonuclease subunit R, EcoR124 family n=1 Tax=Lactobacillus bombicola TaxID=1505723 RepID=UPI000E568771|nr:HsdR family type I site-specific deoxyribonuclease [Lactobacillus bombicola]RHW48890.1 type I restriction endonuclease subunit R [Lactobacillus bombicola]
MSNAPKDATEREFQEKYTRELGKYKWDAPENLNGNTHEVTVKTLIDNWRQELNRLNAEQLEGQELTDNEFDQVLKKVNQIQNSYEAAKRLSNEEGKGKIDRIYRDDNPNVTRDQVTLTIFKKAQVGGGDSSYQIAREVQTEHDNRFDIVLLINGLPLINIEQKRTDKSLDEAFGQFKRYYYDGEYQNNFMAFSQMMVVTSEIETRYFATPKSINDFNPSFVFHWADRKNNIINDWKSVIGNFLMIPMAHQMVGDYLVIDESSDKENRRHMLMRPYQVYALQAIEGAALGKDNFGNPHGGYIWHTTGSGKTITSFKTALVLSTRLSFDKVVFMVDRKELDQRSADNFKAYAAYEPVEVDSTPYTYNLANTMKQKKSGIVVTTTYKMHSLVKKLVENHDKSLAEKHIVFIIDEAQRTTMGDMLGAIKEYFKKNGLFYGFTGTPLFEENHVKGKIKTVRGRSQTIDTTEKLFGPELHRYTIDEAIRDGNVLGFNVNYINTGEYNNIEDLRDQLIEKTLRDHPEKVARKVETEVRSYPADKVEEKAMKEDLLKYQDKTHIPRVVTDVLDHWEEQSQKREFNAILTTAYKERAVAYFDEFQRQLADRQQKLNVAVTFSFGNQNDPDNIADPELVERMFESYAKFTGIKFAFGDKKKGSDAYFEDLVDRTMHGGSGLNSKNIDLIIVADQLLTGYDSKRLNTLYVDRSFELQNLIQAYSRTNRVFDKNKKEFGVIINYQLPAITKKKVNQALELYGSGGKSSRVIVPLYDEAVDIFVKFIEEMKPILPNPANWANLKENESDKERFKQAFKSCSKQLLSVQQYYEYQWDNSKFTITEHEWLKYVGAYRNLFPPEGPDSSEEEEIREIKGRTKLADNQQITASYILNLMRAIGPRKDSLNIDQHDNDIKKIKNAIQELSERGEDQKAQLLNNFLDEKVMTESFNSNNDINDVYNDWKHGKLHQKVTEFSHQWGIDVNVLQKSVDNYDPIDPENIPYVDDINKSISFDEAVDKSYGNLLTHKINVIKKLPIWMRSVSKKYN